MTLPFGYCTNVHAATSIDAIKRCLEKNAVPIRDAMGLDTIPIGLWLNESCIGELSTAAEWQSFADWLLARGLHATTLNGFPQGDFHEPQVKLKVYRPTWAERSRLEYTRALVTGLKYLKGSWCDHGTISTLPLGWRSESSPEFMKSCRDHLLAIAHECHQVHEATGFHCRICIEAEPGCVLGSNRELATFFESWLSDLPETECDRVHRYLGVCFDVCHAAVMFEDVDESLGLLESLGLVVGKVQISSAIAIRQPQDSVLPDATLRTVQSFAEPKYMHQTVVDGQLFDDLPIALEAAKGRDWRIHFHVPIHVEHLGDGVSTTQSQIELTLRHLWNRRDEIDWEIETYAWSVLPAAVRQVRLANGIVAEMQWLSRLWARLAENCK